MTSKKSAKAKRLANPGNLVARTENPFILISHAPSDLQGHDGGGSSGIELVKVDDAFCDALNQTLDETREAFEVALARYPNLLISTILKLRETGIAKSHRPLKLMQAAGLKPAGHAQIDEVLVGTNATSLQALKELIANGPNGKFKANLSALLRIEPWGRSRRNPEGTIVLRDVGKAILRSHRYFDEDTTRIARESLDKLIKNLNIATRNITLGSSEITILTNIDAVSDEKLDELTVCSAAIAAIDRFKSNCRYRQSAVVRR